MTQSPRSKRKRSGDNQNVFTAPAARNGAASGPDLNMERITARLKLLDLRLETLQRDLASLTVSRRQTALARSQYATRSNLKSLNTKSRKKEKLD